MSPLYLDFHSLVLCLVLITVSLYPVSGALSPHLVAVLLVEAALCSLVLGCYSVSSILVGLAGTFTPFAYLAVFPLSLLRHEAFHNSTWLVLPMSRPTIAPQTLFGGLLRFVQEGLQNLLILVPHTLWWVAALLQLHSYSVSNPVRYLFQLSLDGTGWLASFMSRLLRSDPDLPSSPTLPGHGSSSRLLGRLFRTLVWPGFLSQIQSDLLDESGAFFASLFWVLLVVGTVVFVFSQLHPLLLSVLVGSGRRRRSERRASRPAPLVHWFRHSLVVTATLLGLPGLILSLMVHAYHSGLGASSLPLDQVERLPYGSRGMVIQFCAFAPWLAVVVVLWTSFLPWFARTGLPTGGLLLAWATVSSSLYGETSVFVLRVLLIWFFVSYCFSSAAPSDPILSVFPRLHLLSQLITHGLYLVLFLLCLGYQSHLPSMLDLRSELTPNRAYPLLCAFEMLLLVAFATQSVYFSSPVVLPLKLRG